MVVCAHLGRPKGAPEDRVLPAPGRRRASASCSAGRSRSPTDTVGESRPARSSPRSQDGEVAAAGEPPVQPGRDQPRTTPSAAPSPTQLAALADVFVSDGFGVVHRKQASVYDVAQRLPHAGGRPGRDRGRACCGGSPRTPERPYAVVLGGAKVSPTSSAVIDNLLRHGRPAAHRRRHGLHLPRGPGPRGRQEPARGRPARHGQGLPRPTPPSAASRSCCPTDIVAADAFSADAAHDVVAGRRDPGRPDGPGHRARSPARSFAERLADARTVFWNGPMGAFEMAPYAEGTRAVAQALVEVTDAGALTVVGGGDSAAAVRQLGFARRAVRPHLHRWRRQPGVPRGQGAARPRPCSTDERRADWRRHASRRAPRSWPATGR